MIRSRHFATPALLVTTLLAGCGGDNLFTTAVVGRKDAYKADSIILETADGTVIDLINDGAILTVTLDRSANTFESSFDRATVHADVQGDFDVTDTEFVFSDDPFLADDLTTEHRFDLQATDDVLVLTDLATDFDVDGDGLTEPVKMTIILIRR